MEIIMEKTIVLHVYVKSVWMNPRLGLGQKLFADNENIEKELPYR